MPASFDDAVSTALLEAVDARREDLIAFCQRLIRTPSVNGVHPEADLAQVIAEEARRLGLDAQVIGITPERPNVIITAGQGERTGLLLLGHLDTVPTGDENEWRYPPFSGAIDDGRIYGRGAVDTKGGMAAALYALAALARHGKLRDKRARLICVPDEETGATGTLGIRFLAERGLLDGMGAIYAYSGSQITLGHRGLWRCRLICRGESVHTGAQEWQDGALGANAVTGMARLLLALEARQFAYSSAPYFETFRTIMTPGTMIRGGVSINVVPDHCEALMDVRLTPEMNDAAVESIVRGVIAQIEGEHPKLRFSFERMNYVPAAISNERAPLFAILEEAVESVTGTRPPRVVAGPANEGYLLIERGIPTVCGMGPTGDNAHAPDEYVEIDGLVKAAAIFALTAQRMAELV